MKVGDRIEGATENWPLKFKVGSLYGEKSEGIIELNSGLTALVGPNGSGKTRALRAVKAGLDAENIVGRFGRKSHFLAAGRSSPFEAYRAAIETPGWSNENEAAVGNVGYRDQWWHLESITGGLLALDGRADLRLKIEARLQQLFDRSVQLSWSQYGLHVRISPMSGGSTYAANYEASGILQLVGLLAAIHNDQIGALLIDEPEISLHPQHQAFVLEEMEKVAGPPSDPTRKLIIIATHSASMLPLRRISELPTIVFFNSVRQPPAQVPFDSDILRRGKLAAMVGRLSSTHRMALFAERLLLVEGVSDEIIATQLARRLDLRLLAGNAQIVPVLGKGELVEAAKLFRLINKQVAILADLDALADDNGLVRAFSALHQAAEIAERLGRSTLTDLDGDLRGALATFMSKHEVPVDEAAQSYPYWSDNENVSQKKRRVTLARILSDPTSFAEEAANDAMRLSTKFKALINGLAELGCFFLHRGAIESYYGKGTVDRGKPDLAAEEAAGFEATSIQELRLLYSDVIAALSHIAPNQRVDEDQVLRPKLGAILSAAFLSMTPESTDDQLNAIARNTIGTDAEIFSLSNLSNERELRIKVDITSPLFERTAFPFEIGASDNPNMVVRKVLPGIV